MIEPMVEQMAVEMDSDEAAQEDDELISGDDGEVTYTLHALAGYSNPQTMKDCDPFDVTLADGGTLICKSKCLNVKLAVQDQELRADLYLLLLGDYEVVLGIEWLKTLGDVLWNFSELTMKFTLNGKRVTFHGRRGDNVTTVSSHRMEHILKKTCKGYLLQLRSKTTTMPENSRLALAPLLSEFSDLFAEPNALPPQRRIGMTTSLVTGSGKLHLKVKFFRGQGCRQASWVSGVSFKRSIQRELSWSRGVNKLLQIQGNDFSQAPIYKNEIPLRTITLSCLRDGATKDFDFAVIGSGVAGLRYALEVSKYGSVAVITKAEPHESNTNYAQGGVSAVLCPLDSVENHMRDTIVAGAYLCDEETVRVVCTEGPARVRELIAIGASFDHGDDGNLHLAREGGHSHHRIVHAADMTGREIERALLKAVVDNPNIYMFEHHFAIDLLTSQDGSETYCHGVDTLNTETQEVIRFISKVTLLASGGAGHIYPTTTNPLVATGDGIAMALRAQAVISNMEFVQFHPTALADEGLPIKPIKSRENAFLITEAVRGDGGILYNLGMERFMPLYDDRAELAPRDVVARSIDDQLKKRNEKYVLLDISHKPRHKILSHFPNIAAECLRYGLDITCQPIPVVPAAHYMCGGVRAGLHGETNVQGLYVAGEVACTGLHGANRLASNSLLEALVFAQRAVRPSIDQMTSSSLDLSASNSWAQAVVPVSLRSDVLAEIIQRTTEMRKGLQSIMWDYVGIVRSTTRLKTAEQRIGELEAEWEEYLFQQGWEPTMVGLEACEMRNLFCCAKLVVSSALARHESRGLHFTIDFPHLEESKRLPTVIFPCSSVKSTWSSQQLHKQQHC
ncbi:hypothetical protein HHK36_015586 [Tetracentron sinense]|uniref:L-aspartate oxidase n=1 Tax=Tetracentron sinense TaxID=13715 RepID=A0A834Z6G6_TETSI|nr:hypothetical protein HHK36_015586 [Tetracentron sinense]